MGMGFGTGEAPPGNRVLIPGGRGAHTFLPACAVPWYRSIRSTASRPRKKPPCILSI